MKMKMKNVEYLLCRIEHVSQQHTSAGLVDIDWERLHLGFRLDDLALLVGSVRLGCRLICSRKFPHQCVSAIVIKVHTGNVGVIKS